MTACLFLKPWVFKQESSAEIAARIQENYGGACPWSDATIALINEIPLAKSLEALEGLEEGT
jgi:hypothetical protein